MDDIENLILDEVPVDAGLPARLKHQLFAAVILLAVVGEPNLFAPLFLYPLRKVHLCAPEEKTDQQIVDDANALAREFYSIQGYQVPEGYRFDQATHPHERLQWELVVRAYEYIEGTPVDDVLTNIDES